jgi:hypothetical protein
MARVLTDAGLLLLTSISDIDVYELNMLKSLNHPNITLAVNVGENLLGNVPIDLNLEANEPPQRAVAKIRELLNRSIFLDPEYTI